MPEQHAFGEERRDDALEPGPIGTSHPTAARPEVTPAVVLAPLLAFDTAGYRLGYGGGYYDRTLAKLRAGGHRVLAVGIAYSFQQVEAVPHGADDQRLDWIVTEERIFSSGASAGAAA